MEIAFLALALALAGVTGFLHTVFFVYKMIVSRGTAGYEQINYEEQGRHAHTHGSSDLLSGSVPLSSSTLDHSPSRVATRLLTFFFAYMYVTSRPHWQWR